MHERIAGLRNTLLRAVRQPEKAAAAAANRPDEVPERQPLRVGDFGQGGATSSSAISTAMPAGSSASACV